MSLFKLGGWTHPRGYEYQPIRLSIIIIHTEKEWLRILFRYHPDKYFHNYFVDPNILFCRLCVDKYLSLVNSKRLSELSCSCLVYV